MGKSKDKNDSVDVEHWLKCATREFNKIKKIYNIKTVEDWEKFKIFLKNFEKTQEEFNKVHERKVSPEVTAFAILEAQQNLEFVELIEEIYKKNGKELF